MAWFFKKKDKNKEEEKTRIGLSKTKQGFGDKIASLFSRKKISDEFYDELEELLIASDVGIDTTLYIMDHLKDKVKSTKVGNYDDLKEVFKEILGEIISYNPYTITEGKMNVIFVVGVNGVGKTTNIGKLASKFKKENLSVMIGACDTFRAAAIEQMESWANRIDVPIIKQQTGADPGAVLFNAIDSAVSKKVDVLIIDTAGRLHNRVNLMNEINKLNKVFSKKFPDDTSYVKENLLVVDAGTGQNAFQQAKMFNEIIGLTGVLLSKLDSSSKGGIVIPLSHSLKLPVKFVGLGEGIDDLIEFDKDNFINSLF